MKAIEQFFFKSITSIKMAEKIHHVEYVERKNDLANAQNSVYCPFKIANTQIKQQIQGWCITPQVRKDCVQMTMLDRR